AADANASTLKRGAASWRGGPGGATIAAMASDPGERVRRGVLLGVIVAVAGVLVGYSLVHKRSGYGPNPDLVGLAKRVEGVPEFRTWAVAHPDVAREAPRATRRGLHRLDDVTLKRRLTLTRKITAAADVRRCAAFARGGLSQEDNIGLLDVLSPDD